MASQDGQVQTTTRDVMSAVVYVVALMAGVVLICAGRASVTAASGYIAPFLVIYERVIVRRE
jgi:hypothetical protein